MKLSLNWIREYVDLPENLSMDRLSYDLTMSTVEVEGAEALSEMLSGLVVGKIVSVEPHPKADRLRIVSCDLGDPEPSTIVCGGVNLEPEQLVAVARPGAMVRWHGQGEPVEIKPVTLRGVQSCGMICSSGEIGLEDLFPQSREAEIMDISGFPGEPGMSLAKALGLDDVILEIDNKSLTNRPDLWGHYGMARELAAIYRKRMKPLPGKDLPSTAGGLGVRIDDPSRCSRYAALLIGNVKNVPSPFWLRSMIWRVGMRPINVLVDVTNYVMLATGQPAHGFDRSHIAGDIRVRLASPGEKLELLNGEMLELTGEDLVIADGKAPVALAGIMGGSRDSVLPETTELVLEVANFSALAVRRTAQRFDLRTEASSRYEKSLDPQRVDQALALSADLFSRLLPESSLAGFVDVYPVPLHPATVDVSLDFLRKRLGKDLPGVEIGDILSHLGFETAVRGETMHVTAPAWRSTGDISLPDDILEEVARLIGYENFEFIPPRITLTGAVNQRGASMERAVREYLAFRCGMQEIFTYPWIADEYISAAGVAADEMLSLGTPPAPDESRLRSTLIPCLLRSVFTNLRYFGSFRIFELAQVFFNRDFSSVDNPSELLPLQPRHLGGAFVGTDARSLFREARGVLEYLPRIVHASPFSFGQIARPSWVEEKLWLNVLVDEVPAGSMGLLSARSARAAGIKRGQAVLFEMDMERMAPLPSRQNRYSRLPEFPQVEMDLSVQFDEGVAWADVERTVTRADPLVREVRFMDEYRGKQVETGKKSLMFRLWLGSDKGTLTSETVEETSAKILGKLKKQFGGEVRGGM